MKDYKKKMAWLVVLCMIMNILVGNPYGMTLQARENKLVESSVNVDGDGSEWPGLIQQGVAKKVGEGSIHSFGTDTASVTTTAGALYLAADEKDLYYYVEAQVPDWGDWGMVLDLALYVEGQSGGQSKPAWSRQYEFAMDKAPQYHIMVQNRGTNDVAQAQLVTMGLESNKSIDLGGQTRVDSSKGYEGKVKLSDLGITETTNIYAMAVITGNQDSHTAFNVIPESSKNELATDYSANPPKRLGEYAECFEVEIEKPTTPEYISPQVEEGKVYFRYFRSQELGVLGDTSEAKVYLVGEFNNWKALDEEYELTYNAQTQLYEIGIDKGVFKEGKNPYKFTIQTTLTAEAEWDKDPVCKLEENGNSILVRNQFIPPAVTEVVRDVPLTLPTVGGFYDEVKQVYVEVPVTYTLEADIQGVTLSGHKLKVGTDYAQDTIKLQASYKEYTGDLTIKVVDEAFEPNNYISPEVNGHAVTFRYYEDKNTQPVRVAGSFNRWGSSKDTLVNDQNGVGEITLDLAAGRHEYKFIIGENDWRQDPKNLPQEGDNSIVIVSGLDLSGSPESIVKDVPLVLPMMGTVYDQDGGKHEEVPVAYEVIPVEGIEADAISLTTVDGKTEVEINGAYPLKAVKLQASAMIQQEKYTADVILKVEEALYTYTINYLRPTGDYEGWNLWVWIDGKEGVKKDFDTEENFEIKDDSMEGKTTYTFKQATYQIPESRLNFITRQKVGENEWGKQDPDRFIQVPQGEIQEEVWIVDGDNHVYTNYQDIDFARSIVNAFAETSDEVYVVVNKEVGALVNPYVQDEKGEKLQATATKLSDKAYSLKVKTALKPDTLYTVGAEGLKPCVVAMRGILDDYYYEGEDLGLTYSETESTFKVWAPTAKQVMLYTYPDGGNYNVETGLVEDHTNGKPNPMEKAAQGVWQTTIPANLEGQFYMYQVTFPDGKVEYAVDPYARATSANGQRTAIVDLSKTNPSGWQQDEGPELVSQADAILYELHVRDFSMDTQVPFTNRGKFKAFTEEGLTTPQGNKAGVEHLQELGVTHVHLLPVYDFAEVDEMRVDDESYTGRKFNWGYDPQNYNVPEGAYATDVLDPTTRITEFKEMVQALHTHDLGVVMDVVYNHTFNIENGPFNKLVPGYYYRTTEEGNFSNGSGCGNEVASERPMVRKYIKDSVKYWASEYNVDGFRFDLMGLVDTATMEQITQEVRNEVNPNILIYGEPWTGGSTTLPQNEQTLKGSQKDKNFAVFNDEIRGGIKGGSDDGSKGFVTGESGKEKDIVEGIQGAIHTIASQPTEVISYVTAHDNLNLWDKVIMTQGLENEEGFLKMKDGQLENGGSVEEAVRQATIHHGIEAGGVLDNETVKRSLLANGIVLTSQGIPFIHAGDEVLRSKYGDHNSYKSPDAINQIRWADKDKFEPVMDYYKGLIELRKQHTAFRMEQDTQVEKGLKVFAQENNIVAFQLQNYANGDKWKNIVVIYNANTTSQEVKLPHQGEWKVVVDDKQAGTNVLRTLPQATQVDIAPLSMMVLYDVEDQYVSVPTTLEVSPQQVGLAIGGKAQVKVVVKDQKGAIMKNAPITWQLEDNHIAAVNKGSITGLAEGTTLLHVGCGTLIQTVHVNVVPRLIPTTVSIEANDDFVYEGLSVQLTARVKDQFDQLMTGSIVAWSTATPELVKVDRAGKVTGLKPGRATIIATVEGVKASIELLVKTYERRFVVLEYHRPDGNYEDWNIWVWNTGVKEDQIDFVEERDGRKVAYIEVGPSTSRIGFIIRKGDWLEKDVDTDRFITIEPNQTITKVQIESKQQDFKTLVPSTMPVINPQELTMQFNYRDNALFKAGQMNTLSKVEVEINGQFYEMTYNPEEEWFEYTYEGLKEGEYGYCYHVTYADGTTKTYLDPYNKKEKDGKSIITYTKLHFEVEAGAMPYAIDYNQNSVITLEVEGETDQLEHIAIDLTSVGGGIVEVDPTLMALTIGVDQEVTPGMKVLPITLKDTMNNVYKSQVEIEVKGRSVTDADDFDWDEAVIYFMLTDRFNNGNTNNDDPYGMGYDTTDPGTYHGGDFKGVTEKLDYLKALGINTLWISPVVENVAYDVRFDQTPYENSYYGYHGYWAKNFEKLNPHFGTVEAFHTLIDEAHARGMKIMVDVVLNHAGYGMDKDIENAPVGYPTDADREVFKGMLRQQASSDEVTGQLSGLPDFETERSEVRDQIIDWQVSWVDEIGKTQKGNTIDYFRVDTVKHVEDTTWMAFKNELTRVKPDFKMIGEAWGASVDNDLGYLNSGMMDAVLDFSFKDITRKFVSGDLEGANRQLEERNDKLSNKATLGNFLSSHDEEGFLYSLKGNEDLFKVAVSLQATAKGQPIIYYGEELAMSGANNYPKYDNRLDVDWSRVESKADVLGHYQKVLGIRKAYSDVLSKGTRATVGGSNSEGYLAFMRSYKGEEVVIALNTKEAQACTLQVPFKPQSQVQDLYSSTTYTVSERGTVDLTLPSAKAGGTVVLVTKEASEPDEPDKPSEPNEPNEPSSSGSSDTSTTKPVEITAKQIEALLEAAHKDEETLVIKVDKEVVLTKEAYQVLRKAGKSLELDFGKVSLVIDEKTFKEEVWNGSRKMLLSVEMLKAYSSQETLIHIGAPFEVSIQTLSDTGKKAPLSQEATPINIQVTLVKSQIPKGIDTRKIGAYSGNKKGIDLAQLEAAYVGGFYKDGTLQFEMTAPHIYGVGVAEKTFEDVAQGHWAKEAVEVLASRHIVKGQTDNTFAPKATITNAEFAVIVGRLLGLEVTQTDWYSGYVEQPITREEMAYMLASAYAYQEGETLQDVSLRLQSNNLNAFDDADKMSDWAKGAIQICNGLGWIKGYENGTFLPKQTATRAEAAQMILRFLEGYLQ